MSGRHSTFSPRAACRAAKRCNGTSSLAGDPSGSCSSSRTRLRQASWRSAATGDAAEATSADFDDRPSEDWVPVGPEPVPEAIVDALLFVRPPVCLNLPEIPITDRQYHERPPRKMAVNWRGWWAEPKEW